MIFELFKNTKPSVTTANLLYTAVFANTLNFNANITTERDKNAFENLKSFINLPENWIEQYYSEVENSVFVNINDILHNDTKILENYWAIAQIELYNAANLFRNASFLQALECMMDKYHDYLLTIPSISEGKNYIITNSEKIKQTLSEKMLICWNKKPDFDNCDSFRIHDYFRHILLGQTNKLYLRKEILKIIDMR